MINLRGNPFYLSDEDIKWIEETKSSLSLEEKIGQLFSVQSLDINNSSLSSYDAKAVFNNALKYHVGAFHLFGFAPECNKEHQQKLINEVQEKSKIPLLISGDLENGPVSVAHEGTNFGSQMQIAATNSEEMARRYGETIGSEGTAMGFNWHFGPITDINYNFQNPISNTRTFGDTPEVVTKSVVPTIKAIQRYSMAACSKHWPGDGMDDRDQHHVLAINSMEMSEWRNTYKKVYQATFDEGVKSVMSAHIALPSYYEELGITDIERKYTPSSLSLELNQKLLREELGFNGLIVSDASIMSGMDTYCSREELVPRCIAAGIDMFLFVKEIEFDYNAMLKGYKNGIITEKRLDEALTRILALKASLGLYKAKENNTLIKETKQLDIVGCEKHTDWARECAKDSITLVKDIQNIIPISKERYKKVLLIASGATGFASVPFRGEYFEELLKKEGITVTRERVLKEENNDYDLVIFLVNIDPNFYTQSIRMPLAELSLFKWYPTRVPTIFISLGNPYSLYEMPRMKTMINAYNPSEIVQEEVMNCLLGRQSFNGVSPVDPFCGLEDAKI
jgi:beta-N-acetylhexosaminidase